MKKLLLGLALAGALAACQPLAPAAAPTPAQEASAAWFISLPEAYTERGQVPRETDVLLLTPTASALEVPLQYDRGVVETLVWEGDGEGVAELHNTHGQLLYRVREGEPAQTVTVGAGRHTLTIRGAAADVVATPVLEEASSQLRRFERYDAMVAAAAAEAEAEAAAEAMGSRGPIFRYKRCDQLSNLYHDLSEARSRYGLAAYLATRAKIINLLDSHGDVLRRDCPKLIRAVPPEWP